MSFVEQADAVKNQEAQRVGDIAQMVAKCQPSVPLPELVRDLNLLYHEIEAAHYDRIHDEIWQQELPIFRELVGRARQGLKGSPVSLLDYGCGTGFACSQAAEVLGPVNVHELVCVDPSQSMLARSRQRLSGLIPSARYVSEVEAFRANREWLGRFDILLTNSVLHHIYEWPTVLRELLRFLKSGGHYLMGHEPSSRFYANPECQRQYNAFLRERRWRRLLVLGNWTRFLRRKLGLEFDLLRDTAAAAARAGLTVTPLPAHVVGELVDYHVPHLGGARSTKGLDFEEIARDQKWGLEIEAVRTYAFIGGLSEGTLPRKWRHVAERLSRQYPLDGACFSALWKKHL
jgi:SAM-dependent methyltransferase